MSQPSLKQFLVDYCSANQYYFKDADLQANIFRALYWYASNNGKHLAKLFPDLEVDEDDHSFEFYKSQDASYSWKLKSSASNTGSHEGRPCLRKLEKSEPAYRCIDCGFDDTCVLCSRCFDPEEHVGHQITVHISKFDGGICDCGDPEAWTGPFACKSSKNGCGPKTSEDLPEDFKAAIEETIKTVLDFSINIFSVAETEMRRNPSIEDIEESKGNGILVDFIEDNSKEIATEKSNYVLLLWNDDVHSFLEVINLLALFCEKSTAQAEEIADIIDNYGRAPIAFSSNIKTIFRVQSNVNQGGLVTSIRLMRDYLHEEISDRIFQWLLDFSECSLPGVATFVRDTISKLLLATDWTPSVPTPHRKSLDSTCLMYDFTFPEPGRYPLHNVEGEEYDPIPQFNLTSNYMTDFSEPEEYPFHNVEEREYYPITKSESTLNPMSYFPAVIHSRANYLLFFDIRLWKNVRNNIRDLLISTLISDSKSKVEFGVHFASIYPNTIEHFLIAEREPNLSLVSQLSSQLFTAPSVSLEIASDGKSPRIFLEIFYSFLRHMRAGKPYIDDNYRDIIHENYAPYQTDGLIHFYYDVNYLLTRIPKKAILLQDKLFLPVLTHILVSFDEAIIERRALDEHVEYERSDWPYLFHYYDKVLTLAEELFTSFENEGVDKSIIFEYFTTVATRFLKFTFAVDNLDSAKYFMQPSFFREIRVRTKEKSFDIQTISTYGKTASWFHPYEIIFSMVSAKSGGDVDFIEKAMIKVFNMFKHDRSTSISDKNNSAYFSVFFHNTWNTLSFISQIDASMWVRNGQTLKVQSSHYRQQYKNSLYRYDIYWCQIALILMDPDEVFIRLMHYWNVLNWPIDFDSSDSLHAVYMMESFLHYLIIFLSSREQLIGLSDGELKQRLVEREIIQIIGLQPTPFSEIVEESSFDSDDELLKPALNKIATFKPPIGIHDVGTYSLIPEYKRLLDTHYMSFTSSDSEEAIKVVKALNKKAKPEQNFADPHLEPLAGTSFAKIGAFLNTISFNQFLNKLLYCLVDDFHGSNHYEPILNYLLRLLLVAGKNDLQTDLSGTPDYNINTDSFAAMMCVEIDGEFDLGGDFISFFHQDTEKNISYSPVLILFHMHESSLFKNYKGELYGILNYLFQKAPQKINNYFTERLGHSFEHYFYNTEKTKKRSKSDKPEKNKARLKQKKVLAKILKRQRLFAESHSVEEDSSDGTTHIQDEHSDWKYPSGECILCRTSCDSTNDYGVIGRFETTTSTVCVGSKLGYLFLDGSDYTTEFDEAEPESGLISSDLFPANKRYKTEKGEISFHKREQLEPSYDDKGCIEIKKIFTSCGHIMHQKCHADYTKRHVHSSPTFLSINRNSTTCPLCNFYGDVFVSVLWENNTRSYKKDCDTEEDFRGFISTQRQDQSSLTEVQLQKLNTGLSESILNAFDPAKNSKNTSSERLDKALSGSTHLYNKMISAGTSFKVSKFKDLGEDENTLTNFCFFGSLATSISDVERSLRGVGRKPNELSVLDQIPERVVTTLRILSEHSRNLAYLTTLNEPPEINFSSFRELKQKIDSFGLLPTFGVPFDRLVEGILRNTGGLGINPKHLIKNYLIGEICRAINGYCLALKAGGLVWEDPNITRIPTIGEPSESSLASLEKLLLLSYEDVFKTATNKHQVLLVVYSLLLRTVTIFLRKTVILVHALYATDFNDPSKLAEFPTKMEADKLCKLLEISTFDYFLNAMANDEFYGGMVESWNQDTDDSIQQLEFPGILKMVKLPERLDEFFAMPEIKELTINAHKIPVVCLFCGEIAEVQRNDFGFNFEVSNCTEHLKTCQQRMGLFLLPQKNYILVISNSLISFIDAPYLDAHGSSNVKDLPMILNKQRYGYINRTLWLQHTLLDEFIRNSRY